MAAETGKGRLTKRELELEKIKKDFILQRAELAKKLASPIESCGAEPDLNCRGGQEEIVHLCLSQRAEWQEEIRKIDVALERLKDGNFGICEECGDPIEPVRLETNPLAHLCVDCQEEKEKDEKVKNHHGRSIAFQR